jgi:hypothetical protein
MTPPKIVPLPAAEWDATWDLLARRYDELQLLEVPMVVGHYHMMAFLLNSLNVEHEPGLPRFPHPTEATCSHH